MATPETSINLMTGSQPETADVASMIPSQPEGFLLPELDLPDFSTRQLQDLTEQPFFHIHGRVRVPGATDNVPYTLAVASDLLFPKPHIVIPGYGGIKRSSRLLRNALAANHNSVALSYDPVRRSELKNSFCKPQRVHVDTIEAIIEHASNHPLLSEVPAIDFSQFILDPHSMGGMAATRFAERNPGSVALINFIECVGLEQPHMTRFLSRLKPTIAEDIGPAIKNRELDTENAEIAMAYRALRYYLANPVRTAGEMLSCQRADDRDRISRIRNLGVQVSAIYGLKDALIPAKAAHEGSKHLIDEDNWRFIEAGHVAPQTITHAPLFASVIEELTAKLVYGETRLKSVS